MPTCCRTRLRAAGLLAIICTALLTYASAAQPPVRPTPSAPRLGLADVLPSDTIAFVRSYPDMGFWDGLKQGAIGRMADHPEVAEFLDLLKLRRNETIDLILQNTMQGQLVAAELVEHERPEAKALWSRHARELRALVDAPGGSVAAQADRVCPFLLMTVNEQEREFRDLVGKYRDEAAAAQPDVDGFLRELSALGQTLVDEYQQEIDPIVRQHEPILRDLLASQIAIGFRGLDPETGMPLIEVGFSFAQPPDRRKVYAALRDLTQRLLSPGIPVQSVKVNGVPALVIPTPHENFFVLVDNLLIYSRDGEALARMLARHATRETTSLAESPVFLAARRGAEVERDGPFFYLDTQRAIPVLEEVTNRKTVRVIHALGLPSVRAVGVGTHWLGEGLRQTVYLYAPGERTGVLQIFRLEHTLTGGAGEVPDRAQGLAAARVSLRELYEEVPVLIDAVRDIWPSTDDEGPRLSLAALAREQKILGVPTDEVLGSLGDSVIYHAGPYGQALRFDRADPRAFDDVIRRMEEHLGGQFSSDPNGRVFYFNHSGYPLPFAPSYAVLRERNTVLVATHPQVLKSILRDASQKTILDRRDFRRTLGGMPRELGALAYVDAGDSFVNVYDAGLPFLNALTALDALAIDPGILPPGEEVAEHFFGFTLGVTNTPHGIKGTAYSPLGFGGPAVYILDHVISNPALIGVTVGGLYHHLAGFEEITENPGP